MTMGNIDQKMEIDFFTDFLIFLKEAETRDLELTQMGNLKLKEINFFGETFKHDIYCRDDKGSIMWPIRSEEEVYYLQRIRQISSVMNLLYKRKGKLKLSKNGKRFLGLEINDQYEQLVWWYCNRCKWDFGYCTLNKYFIPIPEIMQRNQALIWEYCLKNNDKVT